MNVVVTPDRDAPEVGLEDLKQLMRSVNETTKRLESTHITLQQEVTRLQAELAEANAQLRRSRTLAALGEMAAGIAHEVRNPLASIGLYVQMLGEDVADLEQPAELCGKIARAVGRLDAVVRDVLRFARDTSLTPGPVDVGALVARSLEANQTLLEQADVIALVRDCDVPLEADSGLLEQALGNVIRNAAEAMIEAASPHRELCVSAAREMRRTPDGRREMRVVLQVQDSGPGVTADVHQRMFNPFFTTRRAGTGLGLAIVHRIVDAHGGHVSVSNRPNGGASVELCLPPQALPTEPGA